MRVSYTPDHRRFPFMLTKQWNHRVPLFYSPYQHGEDFQRASALCVYEIILVGGLGNGHGCIIYTLLSNLFHSLLTFSISLRPDRITLLFSATMKKKVKSNWVVGDDIDMDYIFMQKFCLRELSNNFC